MQIEIDDNIADDITIQNLKKDLDILNRICEGDPEDDYSRFVAKAIEIVLGYYQ